VQHHQSPTNYALQEFGLATKFKESKVEQEVTASYKADKYALKATVNPAGKVGSAAVPRSLARQCRRQRLEVPRYLSHGEAPACKQADRRQQQFG